MKNIANYALWTRARGHFYGFFGALSLFFLCSVPVVSQTSATPGYPTQTVRLVVPFTAGTGMDTIARAVARA